MFSKEVLKAIEKLQKARLSLMEKHPFYAVLLLHMQFSLDPMEETAYTDGERIVFGPVFLEKITEKELEFVLMHEVMHAALDHCGRTLESYDFDDFNTACDIVVNSNILYSCGNDLSSITLKDYGIAIHQTPDHKPGYLFTAEEVYGKIQVMKSCNAGEDSDDSPDGTPGGSGPDSSAKGKNKSKDAESKKDEKNKEDDKTDEPARKDGGFDDHTYWGSAGLDEKEDGEGSDVPNSVQIGSYNEGEAEADSFSKQVWLQRMIEATQIAVQIGSYKEGGCGKVPLGVQRILKELTEPQTDWRTVLQNFIQEEVNDYSFNPPDRRFQDSPFLLPDYNEKDEMVKDILFMIDTSGSMSDKAITEVYSEVKGAIDQFGGHLSGWLGFFDAEVVEPKPFACEDEFTIIRPEGGGGTSFHCIFEYVRTHLGADFEPADIIILTDGYAPFPDEEDAMGIPVLWVINNEKVEPPWGRVARIRSDERTF